MSRRLFGDYADLLARASASFHTIPDRMDIHSVVPRSESVDVVRDLCEIRTKISSNLLWKVAQKKDNTFYHKNGVDKDTLSFEGQRKLAKEELERRGNPPYDPSAYLEEGAWEIPSP